MINVQTSVTSYMIDNCNYNYIVPECETVMSIVVREVVVVVGKEGGTVRGLADELHSIPLSATTPVIHCMSSGASRGQVLQ